MLQWPKSGCQRNTCCDCVQRAAGAYGMGQRSLFKRESFMRARPKCEVLRWKRSTWKHQGRPGHCLGHMQSHFGSISFVPCTVPEAHLRLRRGQNACPDQAPCHRIASAHSHHDFTIITSPPPWDLIGSNWIKGEHQTQTGPVISPSQITEMRFYETEADGNHAEEKQTFITLACILWEVRYHHSCGTCMVEPRLKTGTSVTASHGAIGFLNFVKPDTSASPWVLWYLNLKTSFDLSCLGSCRDWIVQSFMFPQNLRMWPYFK